MTATKPIVLLDVDGVVADCGSAMHRLAESFFGMRFPAPSTWTEYDVTKSLGLQAADVKRFWELARSTVWADSIDLYPHALAGVSALREHADVAFCTSPWRGNASWCHYRYELLHRHFPGVDVIQTSAKHRIVGDYLVEDKPEMVALGGRGRWRGLLWDQPYNRATSVDARRVFCWGDVIKVVCR